MKPKIIEAEADYKAALARVEKIFDAAPGSPEADELDSLVAMIEKYEEIAYPISPPILLQPEETDRE